MKSQEEHRANRRFPIKKEIKYSILKRGSHAPDHGKGMTVDISTNGVSIKIRRPLEVGVKLDIEIIILEHPRVSYVGTGHVVWQHKTLTGIKFADGFRIHKEEAASASTIL